MATFKSKLGHIFRRKKDNVVMGTVLFLGTDDTIDNYEEVNIKKEKSNAMLESIKYLTNKTKTKSK